MDRSRVGRGVAILAVVALGIAVVSPAFSAAPLTKAKVKKIAKKIVKKVGDPRFVNVGEDATLGKVTATDYKYATPQTNMLVIPGPQFVPDQPTEPWDYDGYSGVAGCDGGGCTFEAPAILPNGATVTKLHWTYDSGAALDANLHFERNFGNFDHDDIVDINTDACATTPCTKTVNISPGHVVNLNTSHYGIYLDADNNHYTFKVVLEYTTTGVGPVTGKVASGFQGTPGSN